MEVPRLGVESELQPLANPQPHQTLATLVTSQQHRILNPLREAKDGTCVLMDPNQIRFHCARMGAPAENC